MHKVKRNDQFMVTVGLLEETFFVQVMVRTREIGKKHTIMQVSGLTKVTPVRTP